MRTRLLPNLRFAGALFGLNLRAAMEYRASFVTGIGFMAVNDAMWIVFWSIFFSRFPVVRGWELRDIATMWAVVATGFGIATGVFGNCRPLGARVIAEGKLDYHLSVPKNPLAHYLLGSISVPALGDVLFGVGTFTIIVRPDLVQAALFVLLSLTTAVIFVSIGLLVNSLAFYAGNSEALSMQIQNAVITFSTYPLDLFSAWVKVVLFAAVPAGFLSYLPVQLLREFNPAFLAALLCFTAGIAALASAVFYRGLHRYESGSLVMLRG
jgi:ABC-2 type transport system permease protein